MIDGLSAVNPVNGKEIPIWISDYVLMSYGTGAIMAVPAHDERDWEFAKKFNMPIIEVVAGGDVQNEVYTDVAEGTLVNSGFLNGLSVAEAKRKFLSGSKRTTLEKQKQTISCVTGYSPVSVTGVSQFRSYTATNAVTFRFRKNPFRWSCRM